MKLEVGQTVYLLGLGHRSNQNKGGPKPSEVLTVGRKWFTVRGAPRFYFDIETGKQKPTEYMDSYFVYLSKEQYEQELAEVRTRYELSELLRTAHKWPIETVRKVLSILTTLTPTP
jgi:hypothetical protein